MIIPPPAKIQGISQPFIEIKQSDKIIRKEIKNERNRQRENQDLNLTTKILIMNRLGISVDRIASRLNINRKKLLLLKRIPARLYQNFL